jgi:hypothetical protein
VSENTHVKDWYVARVVVLDGENKRLRNELETYKAKVRKLWFLVPLLPSIGAIVAEALKEVFK